MTIPPRSAGSSPGDAPRRVCLTMIVRDEARVLRRCLEAAAPWVDAISLCDTGSKDATPEIALAVGVERGLPTRVHHHAWVDFGHNRTLSLEAARATVEGLGWPLTATYLLLLDADQVLEVEGTFDRARLEADAYALPQRSGSERYWNVRLVRADLARRYRGVTHEYLELAPGVRPTRLPPVGVTDRNDGGARGDKFPRDLALLSAAFERDPSDPRTTFYLARTYRALGDRLRALSMFRRRIACGGWFEEVWHAWFAIAELHREAGDPRAARAALAAAWRVDRHRAEGLHLGARLHREAGRRARAAGLAVRGLRRPFPTDRNLFVDRRPYAYGLREELARSGAGTRHHAAGRRAADALLADRSVPADVKARVRAALPDYATPWPRAEFTRLAPALPEPYAACNPSLLALEDGRVLVNVRGVNYRQRGARSYRVLEPDGVVRTRNVLLTLDAGLRVLEERPLRGEGPSRPGARIEGLEDLRLFGDPSGLRAIATTADRHPSGRIGPSLLRIAPDGRIEAERPVVGFGDRPAEKNWLPWFDRRARRARLLYALDPFVVLDLDVGEGRATPVERRVPTADRSAWRGSAGPLPLAVRGREGLLVLAHEVAWREEEGRRYLHRFVWVADDRATVLASRAFVFRAAGVEFAAGMCLAGDPPRLLVGVGVEDREAWIAALDLDDVVASLEEDPEDASRPPFGPFAP